MKYFFYSLFLLMSFSCANQVAGTDDASVQKGDDDAPAAIEESENNNAAGKLYLRTLMMSSPNGSALTINWIYLGDDGMIVYDPADGVNPVNYTTERTNNAGNIGKYKIQGDQLLINWDNGTTSTLSLEFKDGDISILDGGIMVRQTGVPPGFTLNGQYAAGTAKKTMGNTFTYIFKDDGTFILKRLGSVRTEQGNGKSQDELTGSYSIAGNTLSLEFDDGTKEKAVIGIKDMKGGFRYLIINKSSFRMER